MIDSDAELIEKGLDVCRLLRVLGHHEQANVVGTLRDRLRTVSDAVHRHGLNATADDGPHAHGCSVDRDLWLRVLGTDEPLEAR